MRRTLANTGEKTYTLDADYSDESFDPKSALRKAPETSVHYKHSRSRCAFRISKTAKKAAGFKMKASPLFPDGSDTNVRDKSILFILKDVE